MVGGGGMAPASGPWGTTPWKNIAMAKHKSHVLSNRDTHQIGVEHLDHIIRVPLNALAPDSPGLAFPSRRESMHLLPTHLHKMDFMPMGVRGDGRPATTNSTSDALEDTD